MSAPPWRRGGIGALLALAVVGCDRPPPPAPPDTGSRAAAQGFFAAIIRQDWSSAHAALQEEDRRRLSPERFAALARQYRQGLGIEPQGVHLRACEERGDEAIAHVTLTGRKPDGRQGHFRDAISLRRAESGWVVVLPANFGQPPSQ